MAKNTGHTPGKKHKQKRSMIRRMVPFGATTVLLVVLLILLGTSLRKTNETPPALAPSAEYTSSFGLSSQQEPDTAETASGGDDPAREKEDDAEAENAKGRSDNTEAETSEAQDNREDDWRLILVNRWNPMPEDYEVELTQLANGHAVDSRIYPDLQQMFDDARAEGLMPTISSSYRTADKQQQLLDDKLAAYENEGNSYEDAKELAEAWVAVPGTSEHQMGIAVDITSADREAQAPDVVWQWLKEHCCEYGFIVRYPEEKSDITGVINEPWHFRYVGKEAAKEIMEQDVCLEEYLGRAEH